MTMLPMGFGACLCEQGPQDCHACLHRFGGEQHFGDEEDPVAEVDPDDAHPFYQGVVEDFVGGPAAVQQNAGACVDLLVEPVVEVVVHLSCQVLVAQRVQVDLVGVCVFAGRSRSRGGGIVGGVVGHSDGS